MELMKLIDPNELSDDELDKIIKNLKKDCICHRCPTYNNCTRESNELLFCKIGSSNCPIHKRRCLCPLDCPIYQKFNLNSTFYCTVNKKNKDRLVYHKKVYRV